MSKVKVAVLGSGNIATDLMYKILKRPEHMELALVSGIIPESDGTNYFNIAVVKF